MSRIVSFPLIARDLINGRLAGLEGLDLVTVDRLEEIASKLDGADALIMPGGEAHYSVEIARAVREKAKDLRWIQLTSAGYDGLVAFGVPDGVIVTGNGGALAVPVAEHAMALLLSLSRRLHENVQNQMRRTWERNTQTPVKSLDGSTVLVAGFGSIGREVARRAKAFNMHVIGMRRTPTPDEMADEIVGMDDLKPALKRADAIILCLPLNDATHQIINRETLAACKPDSWIINVGRGGLIDTEALMDALQNGMLGGAGLDVTEPEPVPADHPLWATPNVIISPHVGGGGSRKSYERIADTVTENARRFIAGEDLQELIDLRVMVSGHS
ncbi:D-2-hydroxyacid dehydrogenase [Hoeflea sp. CAU 1731]